MTTDDPTSQKDSQSSPTEPLVRRAYAKLEDAIYWISCAALVTMMFAIFADAAGRYFFNNPLVGTQEIVTRYLLVATIWLAVSRVQRLGGHVAIDFVMNKAPSAVQHIVGVVTNVLAAAVSVVLCIAAASQMIDSMSVRTFGVIELPIWPAWLMIALGSILIAVRLIIDCFQPASAFQAVDPLAQTPSGSDADEGDSTPTSAEGGSAGPEDLVTVEGERG